MIIELFILFIILGFSIYFLGLFMGSKLEEKPSLKAFVFSSLGLSLIIFAFLSVSSFEIQTNNCNETYINNTISNDYSVECLEYQTIIYDGLGYLFSGFVFIVLISLVALALPTKY